MNSPEQQEVSPLKKRVMTTGAVLTAATAIAAGVLLSGKDKSGEESPVVDGGNVPGQIAPEPVDHDSVSKITELTAKGLGMSDAERMRLGVFDIVSYRAPNDSRRLDRESLRQTYNYILDLEEHQAEIPQKYFSFVDRLADLSEQIRAGQQAEVSIGMLNLPESRDDLCIGDQSQTNGPTIVRNANQYREICAPAEISDITVVHRPGVATDAAVFFDQDPGVGAEAHALVHVAGVAAGNQQGETPLEHSFAGFLLDQVIQKGE